MLDSRDVRDFIRSVLILERRASKGRRTGADAVEATVVVMGACALFLTASGLSSPIESRGFREPVLFIIALAVFFSSFAPRITAMLFFGANTRARISDPVEIGDEGGV